MNSLPNYSFKLASSILHNILCFELSRGPHNKHSPRKSSINNIHKMLQSNSLKIKCLSSTIRSAKRTVGRPKDGREETVYAVYVQWLMTRLILEREKHTLATRLLTAFLPTTKCRKDWRLNMGSLCLGSKKDSSAHKQPDFSTICCCGRLEESLSPSRVNGCCKTGRWLKTGCANVANQ